MSSGARDWAVLTDPYGGTAIDYEMLGDNVMEINVDTSHLRQCRRLLHLIGMSCICI